MGKNTNVSEREAFEWLITEKGIDKKLICRSLPDFYVVGDGFYEVKKANYAGAISFHKSQYEDFEQINPKVIIFRFEKGEPIVKDFATLKKNGIAYKGSNYYSRIKLPPTDLEKGSVAKVVNGEGLTVPIVAKIIKAGRLTIPIVIRELLGLEADDLVHGQIQKVKK